MSAASRLLHWTKGSGLHRAAAAFSSLGSLGALYFLSRHDDDPSLHVSHNDTAPTRQAQAPYATGSSFMSPILPIRILRPNKNLEIAYDVRTRNPIYVMEKLTKATLPSRGGRRKRPNFYEESTIVEDDYRSKNSHYRNSGYDRGHMAPAADYPDSTQDTFTLCNVSPQNHVMNVSIWNLLEEWVRRLVRSQDKATTNVYVVTGPLWLPQRQVEDGKFEYQYLGLGKPPNLVSVPTHFFKVIIVVDDDDDGNGVGDNNPTTTYYRQPKIVQYACFVVANHDKLTSKRLEDYIVPWKDLEAVTGLQFFPQWATLEWKDRADHVMRDHFAIVGNNGPSSSSSSGANQESRLLLLTDGSSSSTGSTQRQPAARKKKEQQQDVGLIVHLCADGKCR